MHDRFVPCIQNSPGFQVQIVNILGWIGWRETKSATEYTLRWWGLFNLFFFISTLFIIPHRFCKCTLENGRKLWILLYIHAHEKSTTIAIIKYWLAVKEWLFIGFLLYFFTVLFVSENATEYSVSREKKIRSTILKQ